MRFLEVPDIDTSLKDMSRISDTIEDRIPYIDSVAIWLPRHLEQHERDTIESLCGSLYLPDSPKPMPHQLHWQLRITLHQPSDAAFQFIDEYFGDDYLINCVDLALDLTTRNYHDADRLKIFFDQHLVKLWHGKQRIWLKGETSYSSKKIWVPNKLVIYADRPSKINGETTCHIEWRISTANAVRNHGIHNLQDLINFNHLAFWAKHLQLRVPDLEKIGRRIIGQSRRRKPSLKYRLNGNVTNLDKVRGSNYLCECHRPLQRDYPNVQEFIDNSTFKTYPYLRKLPTDSFLPH